MKEAITNLHGYYTIGAIMLLLATAAVILIFSLLIQVFKEKD